MDYSVGISFGIIAQNSANRYGRRKEGTFWKLQQQKVVFLVSSVQSQISPLPPRKILEKSPNGLPLEKILPTPMPSALHN